MKILDVSTVSLGGAKGWARSVGAHQRFIDVADLYWALAPLFSIPPELPYGQAAKEANYGKYTGVVPASYHNWCGLKTKNGGSNSDPMAHEQFDSDYDGVLAHLWHLYGYAGGKREDLPSLPMNDPRFHLITQVTDTVEGLGGPNSWAPSPSYGREVVTIVGRIRSAAGGGIVEPMVAQIPGFIWIPADEDHFTVGRGGQRIVGGAQHYSGGTNSIGWLTTTSGRNPYKPSDMVSSQFLIKTDPTMEVRGWQFVRIEDTSYTTGSIVNPKTVSVEKEHLLGGHLDATDYAVMAQTWVDIVNYVATHDLGEIPLTRAGIRGHKEWVGDNRVCPDGIDVDRIVREAVERNAHPVPTTRFFDLGGGYGHFLGGGFRAFYENTPQAEYLFGPPLSEEFTGSDSVIRQVFQKAVFEHRPAWPAWNQWHVYLMNVVQNGISISSFERLHQAAFVLQSAP